MVKARGSYTTTPHVPKREPKNYNTHWTIIINSNSNIFYNTFLPSPIIVSLRNSKCIELYVEFSKKKMLIARSSHEASSIKWTRSEYHCIFNGQRDTPLHGARINSPTYLDFNLTQIVRKKSHIPCMDPYHNYAWKGNCTYYPKNELRRVHCTWNTTISQLTWNLIPMDMLMLMRVKVHFKLHSITLVTTKVHVNCGILQC